MQSKPKYPGPQYAEQFSDRSVIDAYTKRPPYPLQVIDLLVDLICDGKRLVLELGCGSGEVTRRIAPYVARVDAVDASADMLELGKRLPGGDQSHIRWIHSKAEDFKYRTLYSQIIAAESLQWMDWPIVMAQVSESLTPRGVLAIIDDRRFLDVPWEDELKDLITGASTNRDYEPYNLVDELVDRNLFRVRGRRLTKPTPFSQSVEDYIESFHSRNGLSRDRMGAAAYEFDDALRKLIRQHTRASNLQFTLISEVIWGRPYSL